MTVLGAHLACVVLVAADVIARSWRIQLLARGLGYPMRFRDAAGVNLVGDAACALTPLRIGGEPTRLALMLRAGLPATAAFVAITYEVLAAWPVIIGIAAVLAWQHLPAWWAAVGGRLVRAATEGWPLVLCVLILTVLAWVWVRRVAPGAAHHLRRPWRRALVHWRRMPAWPLLLSAPLTAVNVVSRVAILPILASTLPTPVPPGTLLVGSFTLLYSQLFLPTPAGLGVVDLGFLAGAAGDLGGAEPRLLLWWRFYTSGAGAVAGVWIGIRLFGWQALRALIPGRARAGESA